MTPWWAVEPWSTRPWPPHTDPKDNSMDARFTPHGLAAGWLQVAAITLVRCSAVAASGMLGLAKWISR